MSKYSLEFTTTIRGRIIVEAGTDVEAEQIGEEMASGTLSYDDLTDGGKSAPSVETEFEDLWRQE